MTFHLYIMRHAKSDWAVAGTPDFERTITTRGEKNSIRVGQWMADNDRVPEKIISSSAVRAKQTIALVAEQFAGSETIIYEKDLYLADPETLTEYIQLYKDGVTSLMLVAHNPGLDQLVHYLSDGLEKEYRSMTTANLAIFEYQDNQFDPATDKGKLIKFIKPKELD